MNILLIGSGGREHALAWKLAQSKLCDKLFCVPGNPGIKEFASCHDINILDHDALCSFAVEKKIDLVVIGPEIPLVAGLADFLRSKDIHVFGPSQKAAQLEGSKGFMKDIVAKAGVPTAFYTRFTDVKSALEYINTHGAPIVIKADGLAAGKGVVVAMNLQEAHEAVHFMLEENGFGDAGASIVIEEFLDGEEISFFAICDGETALPFESAQDHKRVGDGDTGPNTGGMGAYSPARLMTSVLQQKIMNTIVNPTLIAMRNYGCPFTGVLFAGIMMVKGEPKLLEFNVRFGDPECQTLMMRLESDLGEILYAAAKGELSKLPDIEWSNDPSLCVVMAAQGYPQSPKTGTVIDLSHVTLKDKVVIFHAGTKVENEKLLSHGGRVLNICATDLNLLSARNAAYNTIDQIVWLEGFCRRDIAYRALS